LKGPSSQSSSCRKPFATNLSNHFRGKDAGSNDYNSEILNIITGGAFYRALDDATATLINLRANQSLLIDDWNAFQKKLSQKLENGERNSMQLKPGTERSERLASAMEAERRLPNKLKKQTGSLASKATRNSSIMSVLLEYALTNVDAL
jgi:hypothetical protein